MIFHGGAGGGGTLYLTLHCRHRNDLHLKLASGGSHWNASVIVTGSVTRRCPFAACIKLHS